MLFFLLLALNTASADKYLAIAVDNGESYDLICYRDDMMQFWYLTSSSYPVNNVFVVSTDDGEVWYWSCNGSTQIGRLATANHNIVTYMNTNEDADSVFIGPGSDDEIYFYSPKLRTFSVYSFETKSKLKTLNGMKDSNAPVYFMSKDPCELELAIFLGCTENENFTVLVYDLKKDTIIDQHNTTVPSCSETLRLNPKIDTMYSVKDRKILEHTIDKDQFPIEDTDIENIEKIAVGSDEIFFTKPGKLYKLTKSNNKDGSNKNELSMTVTALALYEDQEC